MVYKTTVYRCRRRRNNSVLGFHSLLPNDLDGLAPLRLEILEGWPVAVCHRLVETVELGDAYILGRIADEVTEDLGPGGAVSKNGT